MNVEQTVGLMLASSWDLDRDDEDKPFEDQTIFVVSHHGRQLGVIAVCDDGSKDHGRWYWCCNDDDSSSHECGLHPGENGKSWLTPAQALDSLRAHWSGILRVCTDCGHSVTAAETLRFLRAELEYEYPTCSVCRDEYLQEGIYERRMRAE